MNDRLTPEEYLQKLEARRTQVLEPIDLEPVETPEKTEKVVKTKKKRKKKNYLLRFAIFVVAVVGIIVLLHTSLFYVKEIKVEGNRFYTPAQVIEMSGLQTGKNMYFETKTKPARDALLETPYIKIAEIKKIPMGTIKIVLTERIEYAAVPYEEGYLLIDNEGLVLSTTEKQPQLPLLEGMEDMSFEIGQPLKVEQAYLLTDTLALLNEVDKTDLYFSRVYLSKVLVRAYINDQYYCEGEPSEIINNIENIRSMMAEQYNKGISKGVIRVGSNGYLAFSPKIE